MTIHASLRAVIFALMAGAVLQAADIIDLPSVGRATVTAEVGAAGECYVYTYKVTNPPGSSGSVWNLVIDISKPVGGSDLDTKDIENGPRFLANTSKTVLGRSEAVPMVPVGIQMPAKWVAGLTISGTVIWGAGIEEALLKPGRTLAGFEIKSSGLPAIRAYTVAPRVDFNTLPTTQPTSADDLDRSRRDLTAILDSVVRERLDRWPDGATHGIQARGVREDDSRLYRAGPAAGLDQESGSCRQAHRQAG